MQFKSFHDLTQKAFQIDSDKMTLSANHSATSKYEFEIFNLWAGFFHSTGFWWVLKWKLEHCYIPTISEVTNKLIIIVGRIAWQA